MDHDVNPQLAVAPFAALIDFNAVVNGKPVSSRISADCLLIDYLHEHLGAVGTRFSCGIGACSSCKVALRANPESPWMPLLACYARLSAINGMEIRTVEGLSSGDNLHPLQQAFLEDHSFQCGFSTPGFLMAGFLLIDELRHCPIAEDDLERHVLSAIGGHLCRCTGYVRYFNSICRVIKSMEASGELPWKSEDDENVNVDRSALRFIVRKRSGNDSTVESVFGWFEQPTISWRISEDFDLTTLELTVVANFSDLRTGIAVRDLNVRRFLLSQVKQAVFQLGKISLVSTSPSMDLGMQYPGGAPVRIIGTISLPSDYRALRTQDVDCFGLAALSDGSLRLRSVAPLSIDLLDLELPATRFALEFGLRLDAKIDVMFDLQLTKELRTP